MSMSMLSGMCGFPISEPCKVLHMIDAKSQALIQKAEGPWVLRSQHRHCKTVLKNQEW